MNQATQQTSTSKKSVSNEKFYKRVDIEAAHLEYMDRMDRESAQKKAFYLVSQKYYIQ